MKPRVRQWSSECGGRSSGSECDMASTSDLTSERKVVNIGSPGARLFLMGPYVHCGVLLCWRLNVVMLH